MPHKIEKSAMVTSPSNHGVVLIGGFSVYGSQSHLQRAPQLSTSESNEILELTGKSIASLIWIKLEQNWDYDRCSHVGFIVPDQITTW